MDPISRGFFLGSSGAAGGVDATDITSIDTWTGNETARSITNGIDLAGEGGFILTKRTDANDDNRIFYTASGMGVGKYMSTNLVHAAVTDTDTITAFNSDGFSMGGDTGNIVNGAFREYVGVTIRELEGFLNVVEYAGNATNRTISHSLNAVPEMMIIKNKGPFTENWAIYHKAAGNTKVGKLIDRDAFSTDSQVFNNTTPTSSVFTVGTDDLTNRSGQNYIALLFASLDGICKVDSYTGTGSTINVDCSDFFTGSPRAVLIKNVTTGSTDWGFHYDIDNGNDKYWNMNANDDPFTTEDRIDAHSSGFTVVAGTGDTINSSGDTFMYIAFK